MIVVMLSFVILISLADMDIAGKKETWWFFA